ncbi:type IX secretion system outer membrane channel protein PorV [Flavobacterium macacae]|uniref:Type IX secretion system outer membrane channel protein PorV n=1 Tax=Flavobacterium macacae TaxID=2488993 RepID=A0A3P3W8K9_9FLAO|nr:type IX secretion system outer membrane channel protein PorV [Flavobacterium macacae]RRJ91034.1 type IX secretion system outer membrane channel protein PorV [Flavobacterium macacae]
MKKTALIILCALVFNVSNAQDRVITTGVPFLLIAGDARSAGMGDIGVATSPDVYSQQWNPAKYAFSLDKQGFSLSYTPYLTDLANDIALGQVTYFNRISEQSAFAASLRYFSLGEIEFRQNADDTPNIVKPSELAVDLSYSLRLDERFSMSVAGRFISSSLRIPDGTGDASAATSFAVDISGYYQSEEIAYDDFNGRWRGGFNFQNLGPKLNYNNDDIDSNANFLPANMKLGGGFDFIFDEYNKVSLNLEVNKLLVPTPDFRNENGEVDPDKVNDYNSIGWTEGIFQSFGDAPDGMKEELKEFTWALGAEYWYQDSFAIRAGYFNESEEKGARKFLSLGAGFKYNIVKLDVSYLFSASKVRNPLENTLRFSLSFAFGDQYDEY